MDIRTADTDKTKEQLLAELTALRARLALVERTAGFQDEREARAQVILDEMNQFVGLLDPEGNLLEANPAALDAGGAQRSEVIGRPLWELPWWISSAETQQRLKAAVAAAARGEFVHCDIEVLAGAAGGKVVTVDFSLKPIFDEAGRVVLLLPEGRNVTEQRRAQAEVVRKNEELRRLYQKLHEYDQLKTRFFTGVSHELRTPLALILGSLEKLLAAEGLRAEQRHDLEVVARNARILLKHVNALLDIAKLEAGQLGLRYTAVDLARLVRLTAAHFETLAQDLQIAFSVATPESVPAQVDPEKLERVCLNLLSNAFKFTPAGGRVHCELRTEGEHAIVTFEDTGPGVRPELRQAIFERFRQGETSLPGRLGGTGLGLTIAQELVELHGGTITVEEAPGGGALFRVTLPLLAPGHVDVPGRALEAGAAAELARPLLDELHPGGESHPRAG